MKPVWVAVLEDGGVLVEGEGEGRTWNDVPADARIRSLQIRDLSGGATLVSLDGYARFYAYNESVAKTGRQGVPSAKVIAGVTKGGKVNEVRLDFSWSNDEPPEPRVPASAIRNGLADVDGAEPGR